MFGMGMLAGSLVSSAYANAYALQGLNTYADQGNNAYANSTMIAGTINAQSISNAQLEYQALLAKQAVEHSERMAKASAEQKQAWADADRKATEERIARELKYRHDAMMAYIRDKDTNMATRVERRQKYIKARWVRRGKIAAGIAVGTPVAVAVLAVLWRVAIWTIFS